VGRIPKGIWVAQAIAGGELCVFPSQLNQLTRRLMENQNEQNNEWYKKGWGIVIAVIFWPYFLLWYMWTKTDWSRNAKLLITLTSILVMIIYGAVSGNLQKMNNRTPVQTQTVVETKNIEAERNKQEEAKRKQEEDEAKRKKQEEENKEDINDSIARMCAKNYIEANLKAPSTADFPWFDWQVKKTGENEYLVKSYVDAQNSFGAQIRTNFLCKVSVTNPAKFECETKCATD
jgi:hypothetical protein